MSDKYNDALTAIGAKLVMAEQLRRIIMDWFDKTLGNVYALITVYVFIMLWVVSWWSKELKQWRGRR